MMHPTSRLRAIAHRRRPLARGPGSDGVSNDVALVAVVPEPGASTMVLGGLAMLALYQRRFRLRRTRSSRETQKLVR